MKKAALFALALSVCTSSSLLLADWPHFRGPANDSSIPNAKVTKVSTAKEVWKAPLGDSFGQASIANGKVVAFIKRNDGESAIALDAKTGKELWATPIDRTIADRQGGDGPRTTPAIDGDRVYIYGTYMKLYCLDLNTGKEVWSRDVAKEDGGRNNAAGIRQWGNAASPVVVGDLVIITGGGNGKGIMALNKKSGEVAWAKTDEILTHAAPTVATIHNTLQVICFMQSGLVSIDPKTGDTLWKFAHPFRTSTAASPVVGGKEGDIVYCSAAYGVGAAACKVTKSGDQWEAKQLWRAENQSQNHWATPIHHNGYIYGLFGRASADGPLGCLDITTGEVKWSENGMGSQGSMIKLGDKLVIHRPNGELVVAATNPQKYEELDRKKFLGGKNWTMPAYSDNHLYIRNNTQLICLELQAD